MPRREPMTVVVTADLVDELALQVASERATAFLIAGAAAAAELARQVAGELTLEVAGELARQVARNPRRGDDRREGLRCASSTTRTAITPRARRSRQSKGRGGPTI
jgi:hypothetical protein